MQGQILVICSYYPHILQTKFSFFSKSQKFKWPGKSKKTGISFISYSKLKAIVTAFGEIISVWQLLSSIESVVSCYLKFLRRSVSFLPWSGRLSFVKKFWKRFSEQFGNGTVTVSATVLLYAHEGEAAKLKCWLCCPMGVNDRLLWNNKLLWKSRSDYSRLVYCVLSMTGYFGLSDSNSTTYWKLTVSGNCNQSIVLVECILECERWIWFVAGFSAKKIISFYLFFEIQSLNSNLLQQQRS